MLKIHPCCSKIKIVANLTQTGTGKIINATALDIDHVKVITNIADAITNIFPTISGIGGHIRQNAISIVIREALFLLSYFNNPFLNFPQIVLPLIISEKRNSPRFDIS